MTASTTTRAAIKFSFWTTAAGLLLLLVAGLHSSGQLTQWYYYQAGTDGYAVNVDAFINATPDHPARLEIGAFDRLDGLRAVRVKKGDRLPRNANGVIGDEVVAAGERAGLAEGSLRVFRPWVMENAKGFKFRDTFKHKGVRSYPWAAVYNVAIVALLGFTLGYMAEGFTDLLGFRPDKIRHFEDR